METNRWTAEQRAELEKRLASRPEPPLVQPRPAGTKAPVLPQYNPLGRNMTYTAYKGKCGTCGG